MSVSISSGTPNSRRAEANAEADRSAPRPGDEGRDDAVAGVVVDPRHHLRLRAVSARRAPRVDGAHRTLLASKLHLPPSVVPLVSDFRFRRSAQRLARLTL